jgi:pimeloyl-ACP methyl ester carboxylesterase
LGETVVLLHGLGGTKLKMMPMERALRAAGYDTFALTYPSRRDTIAGLSAFVGERIAHVWGGAGRVHFVTHSMGGLVAARLLLSAPEGRIGRVVMLAPPLGGSEVADRLSRLPPYRWIMGPAAMELTTSTRRLEPPAYELGVIAGTAGWAYPLGTLVLPKPHDGRVAVSRTRIPGLADHVTVPAAHSFIMARPDVQHHTVQFLRTGHFAR